MLAIFFVLVRVVASVPTTSMSSSTKELDFDAALSTDAAAETTFHDDRHVSTVRDSSSTNILVPFARQEFDDFDGRLNDSFFKYVIRTDDYDKNEVPWADGGKPVKVHMSAYLRKVLLHITNVPDHQQAPII